MFHPVVMMEVTPEQELFPEPHQGNPTSLRLGQDGPASRGDVGHAFREAGPVHGRPGVKREISCSMSRPATSGMCLATPSVEA